MFYFRKSLSIKDDFIDSFVYDDFVDTLTYNDFKNSLFEMDLSEQITFKLKKLSIHYRGDHKENFLKFLSSQDKLVELEICKYDDDFVRFKIGFDLIRQFNVKKLTLPIDLVPSNHLNEVETYVNRNVRELYLKGYNNDPIMFNLLMTIFPNLSTLRLEYMLEFTCDRLAEMENLQHLVVDHFKIDCLMNVHIKNLKSLEINHQYPFMFEVYISLKFIR